MEKYSVQFPCPVRRLHVVWRDGDWKIENEVHIESMTLVRSDDLPSVRQGQGVSGFWWEAVDGAGRVIYRHILPDAFDMGMEVFDRDRINRVRAEMQHEISFDILIPDVPEVAELHFYSSARPRDAHGHEHQRLGGAERIAALDVRNKHKEEDHGRY